MTEDAQRFADQMGIKLFETSAKDNINVEEVCFINVYWLQCSLVQPSGKIFCRDEVTFLNKAVFFFFFNFQMFMAITKLVLKTKKERKERQAIQNNDTVNLRKGPKQNKRKCC